MARNLGIFRIGRSSARGRCPQPSPARTRREEEDGTPPDGVALSAREGGRARPSVKETGERDAPAGRLGRSRAERRGEMLGREGTRGLGLGQKATRPRRNKPRAGWLSLFFLF
jgi:hypothetical protein